MKAPAQSTSYATLVLLLVLSGLDQTILSTTLPAIVAVLGRQDLAPWVFSVYLAASTAAIPIYGKLADRFGVRPLITLAAALFALGSLACALAADMPMLVAARLLQGLGGGGLLTLTMLAVSALYPGAERARRMGMLGAAYGGATLVGPLAGGLLLEIAGWQLAFWINIPGAAAALAVLSRARFPPPRATGRRLDHAGALLLAAGVAALVLTASAGAAQGAGAILPSPLVAALGAAILLLGWAVVERQAEDPVVPLALFRSTNFSAAAILSALSGVALFAVVVFLPLYLQRGQGMDAMRCALQTLPLMLGITVGGQLCARTLRGGHGFRRVASCAAIGLTLGFMLLAFSLRQAAVSNWALAIALVPLGLSLGLYFPLVTIVAQRSASPEHIGVATAMPMMLRALGGALGVAALSAGLSQHMTQAAQVGMHTQAQYGQALASGVGTICLWATGTGVLGLLVSRALPTPMLSRAAPDRVGEPSYPGAGRDDRPGSAG